MLTGNKSQNSGFSDEETCESEDIGPGEAHVVQDVHIVPPSMQTPMDFSSSKIDDKNKPDELVTQKSSPDFAFRPAMSAPRLLIITGSLLLIMSGAAIGLIVQQWLTIGLITASSLISWWIIGWKIRGLPISAKSRELDRHLQETREKAEKANLAKTRFLAMASHEMRTPLNGILGMSQLLADSGLNAEQANYINAIKISGDGLFSFVEDMLDITRIETGHFALNPVLTNVLGEVEEICELLAPRAHEKNLEIAALTDADLPANILIDGRRIRQVLINLVGNAIKFTSTGGVSIRVKIISSDPQSSAIRFIIADTGPGIDDEDKERIFEEFEQADMDTTRKYGGAGLGLAISRAIIKKMGGSLSVQDNQPVGTKFIVEIPLDKEQLSGAENSTDYAGFGEKNFLIISGRLVESAIIAEMIEQSGGAAVCVETFDEAKSLLGKNTDYVLIVDEEVLAGNDELSRKIATEYSTIALVQPARRHQFDRYKSIGISSYLIRPVRRHSLLSVLNRGEGFGRSDESRESGYNGETGMNLVVDNPNAKKILLVEDNPVNSLLARSILRKNGHDVHLAEDGAVAVEKFKAEISNGQPYQLIYMDLHMPVMDGLSAVGLMRQFEKEQGRQRTRIIALSADEQEQTRLDSHKAGVDGFMTKPLDIPLLLKNADF